MTIQRESTRTHADQRRLRLAVVGAGHLGRIHARLLADQADVELVAVVDPIAAAREQVAAAAHSQPVADYRDLINGSGDACRVDGVIIATPTMHHREVASDFLHAGVAVLVEKPIATTLAEADDLVAIADSRGAILQVGHIERFNPALTAALPHLQSPRFIEATRSGSFTFRSTDVGVVLDLMIHDIDIALSLANSEIVRIEAVGCSVVTRHEDVAHAWIEFASGCVAQLAASRVGPAVVRRSTVWSSSGCAIIDYGGRSASAMTPSEALRRREFDVDALNMEERADWKDRFAAAHLPVTPVEVSDRNAMVDEQRDFIAAIRTGVTPRVDGRQGRDVLAVALQIVDAIERRSVGRQPQGEDFEPKILHAPQWRPTAHPVDARPHRREAG